MITGTAQNAVQSGNPFGVLQSQSKVPAADPNASLANQTVFLKLLVAQLQNQNPTSPADGVQFISQLAQFTQVEQSLAIKQDLDDIRKAILANGGVPPAAAPALENKPPASN